MSPLVGAKLRRRKTRAERNRLRRKAQNKLCKNDTAAPLHERADFIRHLKKADQVKSSCAVDKSSSGKNSFAITQGRLTRQLGLFNKVKKSENILRAPLVISESVKAQTESEMKRILDLSNTEVVQPVDLNTIDISQPDSKHSQLSQGQRSTHVTPVSSRSAISLNSNNSACNPCDMDTSNIRPKSPETVGNSLPVSPQLADIASNLLEGLKPRQMFPGKHYLFETKEELCKMLRQNVPGSAVSCTPLARIPVGSRMPSLRGSVSSDSVKRNVLDCMPPLDCMPMEGDTAPVRRMVKGKPRPSFMDRTAAACNTMQASNISQFTNSNHLLNGNDNAAVTCLHQATNCPGRLNRNLHACGDHMDVCQPMEYTDACTLHTHVPAFNGQCCAQIQVEHSYPSQMEIDMAEGHCIPGPCPNGVQYAPTASHTLGRSLSVDACIRNYDETQKAVVAQYIHPPGYVYQMPGEFYSTRYHADDIWLQQQPMVDNVSTQPQAQSMDILDYIDHSLEPHNASVSRQANVSLSTDMGDVHYQHTNHNKYAPILHQVQSPDSDDGCTMWYAALPPLPPKPPTGTPSPPEKLYARRLY